MQLKALDLRHQIIRPTLAYLGVCSPVGEELLLATAALESGLNPFCRRNGIGIYQIRARQHRQLWDQYLVLDEELASRVRGLASQHRFLQDPDQELSGNLGYASAIAWLMYQRAGVDLTPDMDANRLAHLWQACFHPDTSRTEEPCRKFRGWLSRFRKAA